MADRRANDDLFELWRDRLEAVAAASARAKLGGEIAFWQERALRYDQTGSLARAAPAVVQRVADLVWPGATVLEIGAGTGEFTLPVARRAARVTALDLSAHMLAELRRKMDEAGLGNVTPVEGDWEATKPTPHDIVLAVNSLYRLRDPRAALTKIVRCAKGRGILVRSIGANPPPPRLALKVLGVHRYRLGSDHGLLVAGLAELGVAAQVEIFTVPRIYTFSSVDEAAAICLPWQGRTEQEWDLARSVVQDAMEIAGLAGPVVYRYPGQVAVMVWEGG